MQKRYLSVILALITLLMLCPLSAFASETYVVEVYNEGSTGFTYVYDQPSESSGANMGKISTGTRITVYRKTGSWLYINGTTTANRKVYGYILAENATPEAEYPSKKPSEIYVINCFHASCNGYCYVYSKPSSANGKNLGRIDNGTEVSYLGMSDDGQWFYISGTNTYGRTVTGYIHNYSAVPADQYYNTSDSDLYEEWVIDCSSRGKKYCYIYDRESSADGKNLGSLRNGTIVYLVSYSGDWLYVKGTNERGKTVMGYIHSWCAHPND